MHFWYVLRLLQLLEAELPPDANCHHAITAGTHGTGPDERAVLVVSLRIGGSSYSFMLDESDFAKPVEQLVGEIIWLHLDGIPSTL